MTLIYFAAKQKYSNLLVVLLSILNAINTPCGKHGSVLQVSSHDGSEEIILVLLDKGADVNAQGGYYGMHYRRHQNVATRRWCRHYSTEAPMPTLKEEDMEMHCRRHHWVA